MESRRIFIKKSVLTATTLVTLPVLSSCVNISTIEAKVPMKSNKIRKAAVLWYSQTGNTQKCGKVLAKTFENKGSRLFAETCVIWIRKKLPMLISS